MGEYPHNQHEDYQDSPDVDAVPTDVQSTHRRLIADGQVWRSRLPSTQRLIERTRRLLAMDASVVQRPPQPIMRRWAPGGDGQRSQTPMKGSLDMMTSRMTSRMRSLGAGIAAVAVVALLAALFYAVAAGRTGSGPGAAPGSGTPTAQAHGRWQTISGLTFATTQQGPSGLPAVAPSDPNTVYEATLAPVKLRRTTDMGAHWTDLHVPGDTSNVEDFQVFVSPLDAKTVFLTITSPLPPKSQESVCPTLMASQTQSGVSAARGSGVAPLAQHLPTSGSIPCSLQYYSTDGGDSWKQLTLPLRAALVDPDRMLAVPTTHILSAQGSRLYAAAGCGPLCSGPGDDIVTSADGGAHWTLADQGIRAAGYNVCDFSAAPSGADVFAITATQSCGNESAPPIYLWRSADAGAHWTKVGQLPANAWLGMAVVARAQGQPLLYIHLPQVTVQGHGTSITDGPTSLKVSADGGKTWTAAPVAGIPGGGVTRPYSGPLCVLSDGTVVENYGEPTATALYGWKLGDTTWRQVAPQIKGDVRQVLVVPQGGSDAFVAVTVAGYAQSGQSITGETITVQSYLP
jgi:hypothetical protein